MSQPAITPGDPLPRIALSTADGRPFDPAHQSVAGDTLVLWLGGGRPSTADLQALAKLREDFAAVEARLVAVTESGPDTPAPSDESDVYYDRDGRLGEIAGAARPVAVVIDPAYRLAGRIPGGPEAALPVCAEIFARSRSGTVSEQAPVLLVRDVLEPALCTRLIAYWNDGTKQEDHVATGATSGAYGAGIKRRSDVFVADRELFSAVKTRLSQRLLPEIGKAFRLRIAGFEALRVGRYSSEDRGHFSRHRDNSTPYTAHRLLAVSLNLNDDYRGGEVRFAEYGRALYRPPAGGAVVFSCALLHQALPVSEGNRLALFTFLFDEAGAKREQELIAAEHAAGRRGVAVGGKS